MERDLNRDWVFPTGGILEFSMSEAQWARFVAGAGRSQATPITLTRVKEDGKMTCVPNIKPPTENRKDAFNKEFQESLKQTLSQFEKAVAELADLSEQKSISKVKLREITSNLSGKLKNLPSNLNFAVESFREVSETVVEEAKAEIEAYFANAAHSAGIKAIQAGKTISPNPPELPPI
jgi:methyl-accepting chemotaxis protein